MNPDLNYGLRTFFAYFKDSFKANELSNQIRVKTLFVIILVVNAVALITSTIIYENLVNSTTYINLSNAVQKYMDSTSPTANTDPTLYLYNMLLLVLPFSSVLYEFLKIKILIYLPYLILSLVSLIYSRDLMAHHLPKRQEPLSKASNVFWRACILQLLFLPLVFFTIDGGDIGTLIVFPFINSIYWFFVFILFDDSKKRKFGAVVADAFRLYKKRFIQLIMLIVFFEVIYSLLESIIQILFNSINKPMLTACVQAFFMAIFQFILIRFLFLIYKDLKHPELIKKENEVDRYGDE